MLIILSSLSISSFIIVAYIDIKTKIIKKEIKRRGDKLKVFEGK
jgi:hypothetical protein